MFKTSKKIILASGSPRRQQYLQELGLEFEIRLKEIDESYPDSLSGKDIAVFISEKKASAFSDLKDNEVLITSDTIVWLNNIALGKPKDKGDAKKMIAKLSGNSHEVITAFTVKTKDSLITKHSITKVFFSDLSSDQIDYYVEKYNPIDKAGAYGIQEWIGLVGINKIEGSYPNVVGLPTALLYKTMLEIVE